MIPPYGLPDALLAAKLKAGDQQAYHILVQRHQDFCNTHSLVIIKDRGKALILSQETFRYIERCSAEIPAVYIEEPARPFWMYVASVIHQLSDILTDEDYEDFANQVG